MRELGCDLAQGFLFAHPMPNDEMTRLLETGGAVEAVPGSEPSRAL